MKKILSFLLCAALLLCFAGCTKEPASNVPPAFDTPEAAGVLFVSIGAEFKIVYDTQGLVIAVDSMNAAANETLTTYTSYAGSACDTVVSKLVETAIDLGSNQSNRVVIIKQASDSQVPSANFLEDVRVDTVAVTDFEVVLITADTLTVDGYISADAAKDILLRQLKLTDVTISCSEVKNGLYTLTFETDGAEQEYRVDAATGTVVLETNTGNEIIPDLDIPDDGGEPQEEIMEDPAGDPANDGQLDSPMDDLM
ncbi:MAG: hypothetical protein IKD34_08785 [Oscillospiraceae bacterium]|nr:hypothetical protein [Oscillospiraceae bacterium]